MALVLLLAIALIAATTVGMLIVAGGASGQPGPDVTRAMLLAGSVWAGVAGFLLFWVNGAVGVIGTAGNDVNAAGDQTGGVVMMTWIRPILRAFGMGLTWAVGWALLGLGIGISTGFLPDGHFMQSFLDPWLALATPGFIGGVIFSVVLRIAEGHRSFVELSLPRAGAWGAVTGLILGIVPFTPLATPTGAFPLWLLGAGIIGMAILLSTVSAAGSLSLARIAESHGR